VFLRKTSLDELPQLWNVVKGQMSLIGPRPIIQDEVKFYGSKWHIVSSTIPGMTGLWQVSGRSDTGYHERVELDNYYIQNWSIWLDLYIVFKTAWIVATSKGAY
jgi:lipopolysaccharide/colanic/teichoic acid biosynthesis glycosyltransferase